MLAFENEQWVIGQASVGGMVLLEEFLKVLAITKHCLAKQAEDLRRIDDRRRQVRHHRRFQFVLRVVSTACLSYSRAQVTGSCGGASWRPFVLGVSGKAFERCPRLHTHFGVMTAQYGFSI